MDLIAVLCVKPKHNRRRILAQSGALLLFGRAADLDTTSAPGIKTERIRINVRTKGAERSCSAPLTHASHLHCRLSSYPIRELAWPYV